MKTNAIQVKFLALVVTVFMLFVSCQKQNTGKGDSNSNSAIAPPPSPGQGLGALLNRDAFLKLPVANVSAILASLKSNGLSPKFEKFEANNLLIQTISPDPAPPAAVTLLHPAIGNQGNTNTCVSWSVGYCAKEVLDLTWHNATADNGIRSGWFLYNMIYSTPQYASTAYQCSPANVPPEGGTGLYTIDGLSYAQRFGVASQTAEPSYATCNPAPSAAAQTSAATDKPLSYAAVTNISTAKELLAAGIPVVFTFNFYNDFRTAFNTNQQWNTTNSPATGTAHSICFIGYDDFHEAFLAQNSWGIYNASGGPGGDLTYPGCIWVNYGVAAQLLAQGYQSGGAEAYEMQPVSTTPLANYYNPLMYEVLGPAGCSGGLIPNPSQVVYAVPANKYSSPVSLNAAVALGSNDELTNAQTFANEHLNGCVVPPGPTPMYNIIIVGNFSGSSTYNVIVNGGQILGPLTMGAHTGNSYSFANPPIAANATVVIQVTSGYMPVAVQYEGPETSPVNVINSTSKTITLTGVTMFGGQTCEIILN